MINSGWQSVVAIITLLCAAIVGLLAFTWPLLLRPQSALANLNTALAPIIFGVIIMMIIVVVATQISSRQIDVVQLSLLAVLTAIGAALRPLGTGTAGMEAVFFLIIMGGRVFGAGFGFTLGMTTLFTSALLTAGFGPWLPYQMLAAGFVGMGAGFLPKLRGWLEVWLLAGYGFIVGFGYGWLMDLAFWPFSIGRDTQLSYVAGATIQDNLARFIAFNLATAMAWNLGRALTNLVLTLVLGKAVLLVLRRAARRAFIRPEPRCPSPSSMQLDH